MMGDLIDFCFRGGDKGFIRITKYGVGCLKSQQKHSFSFDKASLNSNLNINYIQNNCYFTLIGICFHSLVWISMGYHPATFMTDLFFLLSSKEVVFSKEKADPSKGASIFRIFGFIDDVHTFNNNEFENNYNDIYRK